jgi:hypothetical protein
MNAIEAGFNAHRERLRFGKYENVESKVLEWVAKAQKLLKDSHITLSASIIRFKAADIAREMQIPNFKASRGWWDRFRKRWCLQRHVFHGEASSVDLESTTITTGIQEIKEKLAAVPADRVFNMDETGLMYRYSFCSDYG